MDELKDDLFDEHNIKKAIKKGKRKTIITVVFVSVIVFVVLNAVNFAAYSYYSQKAYKQWDAYVRLSTPNGYISETVDTRGILGGETQFKVSKNMKTKSLVLEQKQYKFGLLPSLSYSRISGNSIGVTGEDWQVTYKENGWRDLLFFHPTVSYKKYKHDEDLINQMQGDQIYEVALSFDKPYKQSDLPLYELPAMTWFWINTYSYRQMKIFQEEAEKNVWSSTFIRENEALGFSVNSPIYSTIKFDSEYEDFLNLLQSSYYDEHQNAFEIMKDIKADDVEILGIVVYGTKEEVIEIIQNPIIQSVSLGGVINNY